MLKRTLASILLVLMIVSLLPAPAWAEPFPDPKNGDTEPPQVTNIVLSGTTIVAPGSVTATVSCTDASGVAACSISFWNTDAETGFNCYLADAGGGSWTGQIELNEYQKPGEYVINFVNVQDTAGNYATYLGDGWTHETNAESLFLPANLASLKITVTNNSGMDFEAPTLSNLTLSAASITAPGSVAVTVNCADNDSGVASVFVMFEIAAQQTNLSCSLQEVSAGIWAGQIPAYESTSPGDYVISNVILRDRSMNSRTYLGEGNAYYASEPANKKLPADLASLKITVNNPSMPPIITAQPQSVSAAVGTTATFKVNATNATAYQWQYRKTSSGSWTNSPAAGNTTGTLKVAVSAAKDGYQYRCVVTNAAGSVTSTAATLTVSGVKPAITQQPQNVTAAAGSTATFTITATGATAYQWQFRKTPDGAWVNATADGNKTATLKVPVAAYKNGYQYRCKVTNAAGSVFSSVATLHVLSKPTITAQPQNVTAAAGSTATFTITATGATAYQWQFRKTPDGAWVNATADGNKTATLKVPVAAYKNGYQYRCKVTNAAGSVISSVATLTVAVPTVPTITAQPQDVSAAAGTSAVFTVTATGAETYQWQFRKSASGSWANSPAAGNTTATLRVSVSAAKNGYQYRCIVTNAVGSVESAVATLTVAVPTAPTITQQPQDVSAAAGTTAVFTVAATGAESYQWQYRKSASGSWANSPATGNTTATLRVSVSAGKNGYQYRCVVSNAYGTAESAVATLYTIAPTITQQPQDVSAAPGTTATFTVAAVGVTGYQWQFRKSADGTWTNSPASGNTTATLRVSVTESKNGYQYRCIVSNPFALRESAVATLTVTG